jgi:hypothetical protein
MVNSQPIRKKDSHWKLYLIGVGLAGLTAFIFEVSLFEYYLWEATILFRIAAFTIPFVVLLGVILLLTIGTKIIPWRYTSFGPYERTPPPNGFQPHIRLSVAPRQPNFIQHLNIGREGMELTFGRLETSHAFLPASSITSIGPATRWTYVVEHDSPEIESPLIVSPEVGEAILAGLGRPPGGC